MYNSVSHMYSSVSHMYSTTKCHTCTVKGHTHTVHQKVYLFLQNLCLSVVVHGAGGIGEVLGSILDIVTGVHHTGTAGEDQLLWRVK